MTHPSIRLEGSLLSADILDAIERGEKSHQSAKDFGLDPTSKVKDEIADAWAAARAYWAAYQVRLGRLRDGATGTTETRNLWMIPFLELLGYHPNLAESETIQGKTYRISHRDPTRDNFPLHIIGWHESLDRRSTVPNAPRMSPHGLVQEYINLTEHLYGIVSNGRLFRLLRDSSRLVNLTFIEFDLERILTEELFADFALLYRLLHASRLPVRQHAVAEAPIEIYHQDSLDSGSRIRDGLSSAVHRVILDLANGLLNHQANGRLRDLAVRPDFAPGFYAHLLRLIYRLLFLMVIEERGLIHVRGTDKRLREIYDLGYSLARLRRLSEKSHFADTRHSDAWFAVIALFRLVDESGRGLKLGVAPLGGDLFNRGSLGVLEDCSLDNATFLGALRQLTLFTNPVTRQLMRVNYGALNVEEFGSVYQGLLEFEPRVTEIEGKWHFAFAQGDERAATGSHYTEDELVQPLLKHSLDHLIAEKVKQPDPAAALLSLRVADISCGSGHILLAAARRIGMALAIVRTGDDQPSPAAYREAVRDVIKNCIYGVDLNPLAVELCKVALWLEAHVPGEPLGFLDHHIKCGNAIVGFVNRDELDKGIPDEAFKTLPGDDKDIAAVFRKTNKAERMERATGQKQLPFSPELQEKLDAVLANVMELSTLPEHTPAQTAAKERFYAAQSRDAAFLRQIAAIPIAQFYQPKTAGNKTSLITDATFRHYLAGRSLQDTASEAAWEIADRKKFFHWFLEFPDIIAKGGFDCILGNPPYLGDKKQKRAYGEEFQNFTRWEYAANSAPDIAAFFCRRIADLLIPDGCAALITTNTVAQGATREEGLDVLLKRGAKINYANPSIPWPGQANVIVSLFCFFKRTKTPACFINKTPVDQILGSLREPVNNNELSPTQLLENQGLAFTGTYVNGEGFFLTSQQAEKIIANSSPATREVIRRHINGRDLYSSPIQSGSRCVIDFGERSLSQARGFSSVFDLIESTVKPIRLKQTDKSNRENWWLHARRRPELYAKICDYESVLVCARVSSTCAVSLVSAKQVLDEKLVVFAMPGYHSFAFLQSCFHWEWVWFRCTTMKNDVTYGVQRVFETLPMPRVLQTDNVPLAAIGERYHEHRRDLMLRLWLGLTDIYNLFHAPDLEARLATLHAKRTKTADWRNEVPAEHRPLAGSLSPEHAHATILELRALHRALDQAVLTAYGWHTGSADGPAINLGHDFQEVETLPENDRIRYTISPTARKELLKRLLALNHTRAAEEAARRTAEAKKPAKTTKRKKTETFKVDDLFDLARKETTTPARNWMDQPLVVPSIPRFAWDPEKYRAAVVPQLLHQAGGKLPFERFRRAYWLLTEPTLLAKFGEAQLGQVVADWRKVFCDKLSKDDFIAHLESAIGGHLHFIRVEGDLWIERTAAPLSPDEHIQFDARISLFVADLWPSDEPIEDFTPTEHQRIEKLEAVS